MHDAQTNRLTIMADYGGAYLWCSTTDGELGGCYDDHYFKSVGMPAPKDLVRALEAWQREFAVAENVYPGCFARVNWPRC